MPSLDTDAGAMKTRPVLLWPRPRSDIRAILGCGEDAFVVIETTSQADLRLLYQLTSDTPVFDPFPTAGRHYRAYLAHIEDTGCRFHIAGLAPCREVFAALCDASIARGTMEDLLLALGYLDAKTLRTRVVIPPDPWWRVWLERLRRWWEDVVDLARHYLARAQRYLHEKSKP